MNEFIEWSQEMFGEADLGDSRRTARLVKVAARAAENPSGKLSEVFGCSRELDGAYDFVEREQTSVADLQRAAGESTAARSVGQLHVFVPVDGSSVSIVDTEGTKGFGRVGTITAGAQGIKVMNALAIGADGIPIGVLWQSWWSRTNAVKRSEKEKRKERGNRTADQKETRFWKQTIDACVELLDEVGVRAWFQLDREADAWPTLVALAESGHRFTVRSSWDRVLQAIGQDKQYLQAKLSQSKPIGSYKLDVPGRAGRQGRQAHMVMYAVQVTLKLRDKRTEKVRPFPVSAVWVCERGTTPSGEKPLEWRLLTNAPIATAEDARSVVLGYSVRWRIEEFHKTWKSGGCKVELTQLRSRNAVIRWAIILAVVAMRIERIKLLGRNEPSRPASDVLSAVEIEVLVALKRRYKKYTETVPDGVPTMAQATRWIADIGGYTGKSSGGPPGSITIGRGLERLKNGVEAVMALREHLQ